MQLTECLFTDDAALLATTCTGAEQAIQSFVEVASAFGLTVSLPKIKHLVTGNVVQLGGGEGTDSLGRWHY